MKSYSCNHENLASDLSLSFAPSTTNELIKLAGRNLANHIPAIYSSAHASTRYRLLTPVKCEIPRARGVGGGWWVGGVAPKHASCDI